ncbi:hypothetical protein E2562_014585 [Oryza meyeriana var. granulata]|uniref:Uncharacterized protein n=1 Tax=Oryza meyeriana var. granulata TaxID=110450 RepID=A0A6G1DWP2_9ORYZ|nr:hypothetical protein E2562_014585 [Oryza meyeriana var. granulata]
MRCSVASTCSKARFRASCAGWPHGGWRRGGALEVVRVPELVAAREGARLEAVEWRGPRGSGATPRAEAERVAQDVLLVRQVGPRRQGQRRRRPLPALRVYAFAAVCGEASNPRSVRVPRRLAAREKSDSESSSSVGDTGDSDCLRESHSELTETSFSLSLESIVNRHYSC